MISPLLANIYLHQVMDVWMTWWRSQDGRGETSIVTERSRIGCQLPIRTESKPPRCQLRQVRQNLGLLTLGELSQLGALAVFSRCVERVATTHLRKLSWYADDFVVGFQSRVDAERFLHDLRVRLAKFALTLHPDKTRRIEFGRFAAANRTERGDDKPETFSFLGFTHHCAKRRSDGRFTVIRTSMAKRLGATVQRIGQALKENRALPIVQHGRWLGSVVRGWLNYHAVPGNSRAMHAFMDRIMDARRRALSRRSQTAHTG